MLFFGKNSTQTVTENLKSKDRPIRTHLDAKNELGVVGGSVHVLEKDVADFTQPS